MRGSGESIVRFESVSLRVLVVAVIGMLVLAACSSTTQKSDEAEELAGSAEGEESSVMEEGVDEGDGEDGGDQQRPGVENLGEGRTESEGGERSQSEGSVSGSGESGEGSSADGPAPGESSSGATWDGPISVGFIGEDLGEYEGVVAGAAIGDTEKEAKVVADWINRNGGLGGHKLDLIYHEVERGSGQRAREEAACTRFTQDEEVLAVLTAYTASPSFQECFVQAGMPFISNVFTEAPETSKFQAWETVYYTGPARDRTARTHVDALKSFDYFSDLGMKLGLVTRDNFLGESYAENFKRRLSEHGVELTAEASICGNCGNQDAQYQNAIVKFKQKGVSHVVGDGAAGLNFMTAARQQAYNPRYGMTTEWIPILLSLSVAPDQLENSVGMGIWQEIDVHEEQEPELTSGKKWCRRLMREAGEPQNRLAQANYTGVCGSLNLLKAGMDRAPEVSVGGLQAGIETIEDQERPIVPWSAFYGAARHDGAETYRPFAYEVGCRCFKYTEGERRMASP